MGRVCSMYGKMVKCYSENLMRKDNFGDLGIDGRIILN
jgi:hypothetical protein